MLTVDRSKTPREIAWDAALTVRMNMLYYKRRIAWYEGVDLALRIITAIAASSGAVIGVVKTWGSVGEMVAAAMAFAAAVAAVVSPILRLNERARVASVLLHEYTQHYQVLEGLFEAGVQSYEGDLATAIASFNATELKEAKEAPSSDDKLLRECEAAVRREIGAIPAV